MASRIAFIVLVILCISHVKSDISLGENDLVGIYPPVYTTFESIYDNDTVKVGNIPYYAKFLADNGIPGVILAGTNGEGTLTTLEERMVLTDAWMAAGKQNNLQIILQVSGLPFPDALQLAKYAGRTGVNAILAYPELYYRPVNVGELVYYIRLLAEQAPKTPIFYYDIPGATNVRLNMVEFFKNATRLIPSFCGLKTSLSNALQVMARTQLQSYQRIFSRTDTELASSFELKVNGTISATCNFFPKLCTLIVKAVQSKNFTKAHDLQLKLNKRIGAITYNDETQETVSVGRNKATMELVTGINVGELRRPLMMVTNDIKRSIAQKLMALGVKIAQKKKYSE